METQGKGGWGIEIVGDIKTVIQSKKNERVGGEKKVTATERRMKMRQNVLRFKWKVCWKNNEAGGGFERPFMTSFRTPPPPLKPDT